MIKWQLRSFTIVLCMDKVKLYLYLIKAVYNFSCLSPTPLIIYWVEFILGLDDAPVAESFSTGLTDVKQHKCKITTLHVGCLTSI